MQILRELGRGASTIVYQVRRDGTGYALKVFNAVVGDDPDPGSALIGFRRQAAIMASIDHPGLPRIYDVGLLRGRPYLVMELINGDSLADVLEGGRLPPARGARLALDIARALVPVHRKGLVHRDVKPQNIMVVGGEHAKLIDFDLATRENAEGKASAGTLAYAPPEQSGLLNRPVDGRSDLYSLGVVLFECLTGTSPFPVDDLGELLRMHATVAPPDPRSMVPQIPPALGAIVTMLLTKDPDDRYQSSDDLVADLHRLVAEPTVAFAPGQHRHAASARTEPLSGRDHELERLTRRWARARDGEGGICIIRGPGGSGKSRLAAEIVAIARDQHALVLSGKSSADNAMPLAPLRFAVDEVLRALTLLPGAEQERWRDLLRSTAGLAAPLLGMITPALRQWLGTGNLDDGERSEQFTVAVVDVMSELARACGGLLLHLDDVQWIDPGTRRIIARLATVVRDVPLLVLCTARDDEASVAATEDFRDALGHAVDLEITLGVLDEQGIAGLIASQLPGMDTGSALARLLTGRGAGNPFVVLEYLRAIIDAGLLLPSWDGWMLNEKGLGTLELPVDALGLVLARVDALGSGSRRILATAAAVGPSFRPAQVAQVCGVDPGRVLAAVVEAAGHHLVEPRDGGEYTFLHDQIREALLEEIDGSGRSTLHRRIADVLAKGPVDEPHLVYALARHYLLADPTDATDQVFSACFAAGRLALADHAPAMATAFLEHAAAVREQAADGPLDAAFLHALGVALHREGRYAPARVRLEQAFAAETTPAGRAGIMLELGKVRLATWNVPAALRAVDQGLAELGAPVPKRALLAALSTVASCFAGFLVSATGIGAGTAGSQRVARYELIAAFHTIAAYTSMVNMNDGMLLLHGMRVVYPLNRLGRGAVYAWGEAGVGAVTRLLGLRSLADRCFRKAGRAATELGDPGLVAMTRWIHGAATYMSGGDDGAAWTRALEEHGRWLDPGLWDDGCDSIALDHLVAGRTRQAASWYDRGTRRGVRDAKDIGALITADAVVNAATGRHPEAGVELRRIQAVVEKYGNRGLTFKLVFAELFACMEQGEFGEPFDRAVRDSLAFGLRPRFTPRQVRVLWVYGALGRIAQCGLPGDDALRRRRRKAAGQALRQLRATANNAFLHNALRLAQAQLHLVDGRPRRCLRSLAAMTVLEPDAPMLAYEALRTRARALRALGHEAEAIRQATFAHAVAVAEGWPHRVRWIRGEFEIPTSGVGNSRVHGSTSTTPGGGERQRLLALAAVSKAAARVVDPDAVARIALDETIRVLSADRAFLFLTADQRLVAHLGRDAEGNDIEEITGYTTTLVERVSATGEPIVVTGTEEGAALGAQSAVLHGLRSILVAPLRLDDRILGVVYLDSQVAKGIFTTEDVDILTAMTDHIATSLETARAAQLEVSVQVARRQRDLAEMLHDALTEMSALLDPDDVLDCLLRRTARLAEGQGACLLIRTGSEVTARLLARDGDPVRVLDIAAEASLTHLFTVERVTTMAGELVPAPLAGALGPVGSWLAVPLAARNASLGVLLLTSPTADAHQETEVNVVAALVAQAMTAHDNAALFAQVQALAVIDELTGIPNRRQFFALAEQNMATARRHEQPVVAIMADIDNFKRVNDTYGHLAGDDVIQAVARRLATEVRTADRLCRYGGEEFAILLFDTDVEAGGVLAQRLRATVGDHPIDTRAGSLSVTISIGLAALQPGTEGIAPLLARADQGLYLAKQGGRNQVQIA